MEVERGGWAGARVADATKRTYALGFSAVHLALSVSLLTLTLTLTLAEPLFDGDQEHGVLTQDTARSARHTIGSKSRAGSIPEIKIGA
jgi:hypothetical protein